VFGGSGNCPSVSPGIGLVTTTSVGAPVTSNVMLL
jgi:hypothetical protein